MIAIIRKEFRGTLAYFILLLFLIAMGIVHQLLTEPLDQWSALKPLQERDNDGLVAAIVTACIALPLAWRLFASEADNKTIEFLDALPVSRTRVFFAKLIVALLVINIPDALSYAWTLMVGALAKTSLQTGAYVFIIAQEAFRDLVFNFFILGLAFLFSFFRGFGWLFFPLLFISVRWIKPWMPGLSLLLPDAVFAERYEGEVMVLPYRSFVACTAVALLAYVLSWRLFCGRGTDILTKARALGRRGSVRLLFGVGIAIAVVVGAVISARERMNTQQAKQATDDDAARRLAQVEFEDFGLAEARTKYYVIHYPESLRDTGRALVARADEAHDFIRTRLDAAPSHDPIQVDGTAPLAHAGRLGQTVGASIGLDLKASPDPLLVLAHETAHFYAEALAHQRLAAHGNATRFFHEGLALHLANAFLLAHGGLRAANANNSTASSKTNSDGRIRTTAPIGWEIELAWLDRFQATRLDEVMNASAYTQRYGEEAIYAVGQVFVESLVELDGPNALPAVLKAFGRDNAPNNLEGEALFRDAFQAAHLSYDAVASRTQLRVAAFAKRYKHLLDALPALSGSIEADDQFVRLRPHLPSDGADGSDGFNALDTRDACDACDHPEGRTFHVIARFRPSDEAKGDELYAGQFEGGTYRIARSIFPSNTVSFQLGVRVALDSQPSVILWTPWTTLSL